MPSPVSSIFRSAQVAVTARGYSPRGRHTAWSVQRWLEARRGVAVCPDCERDTPDCRCAACPSCGATGGGNLCRACGQCAGCCGCSRYLRGHRRATRAEAYPFHGEPTPALPRYVAAEIECGVTGGTGPAFAAANAVLARWKAEVHDDGSISGFGQTAEVCTAPARGNAWEAQVREVTRALAGVGARANASCGLHVHVNVADFTDSDLCTLFALWARVEDGAFQVVARSRRGAHWCRKAGPTIARAIARSVPGASASDRWAAIEAAFYGSPEVAALYKRSKEKHGCRYHAVNVNAVHRYGTLEFRLHHGTVNREKIANWGRVCAAVVQWAKVNGETAVEALPLDPWEAFLAVLPADLRGWCTARRAALAGGRNV